MAIVAETGWTEEYILWQLPMRRAWGYYHCACQRNAVEVISSEQAAKRGEKFDSMVERLTRNARKDHGRKI
jgi:hypothetical protein